jgi:hypothetical protein
MINYWVRIAAGDENKLSRIMLHNLTKMQNDMSFSSRWTSCIKGILDSCGLSYVWDSAVPINIEWLKRAVEKSLQDQFLQTWRQDLESKSSCDFYRNFKQTFILESYLVSRNAKGRKAICQFRTSNNKLPKITGRYRNIPRHERHCTACDKKVLGDEYHLLIECSNPMIVHARSKYLPKFLFKRPSVAKCTTWIQELSDRDVKSLGNFLANTLQVFK